MRVWMSEYGRALRPVKISVGDYVLSGGELAAMILIRRCNPSYSGGSGIY